MPLVLLVAGCLVAGTAAVSGASTGGPGVRFAGVGRWFADAGADRVFHVNGMSRTVDAQVTLGEVEPGTEVVEGGRSSYVIGPEVIRELDGSSLTVTGTTAAPARERPVTVDAAGGPYAVYRDAGKVVRLADEVVIEAHGPLGAPVATPDGTLWLHRVAAGLLCHLRPDTDRVTCPVSVPPGHAGALSVLDETAVFLDVTDDTMTVLALDGPGPVTAAGADLPPGALVAPGAVRGRIAVVAGGELLLLDAQGIAGEVVLPPGRWAAPVAGRSSIVLLELRGRQIHTYDPAGGPQRITPLPPAAGDPLLRQSQDGRVYVQSGDGRHVLVVDDDGGAEAVAGGGDQGSAASDPGRSAPAVRPSPGAGPTATATARLGTPPSVTSAPEQAPPAPRTTPPSPLPQLPGPVDPDRPGAAGPEPLPAGRPGRPPGLSAVARSTELILTWGAAPPNGATITAYEVTWSAATGDQGSTVVDGDARTALVGGLPRGVPYRIGVAARNANGRGEAAVVDATLPNRWITVSRGKDDTHEDDCGPPECANIRVELFGFPPLTAVQLTPMASVWGRFNGSGAELTTDGNGHLLSQSRFPFGGVGQTVWVDVDDTQSNRFLWPERGPS